MISKIFLCMYTGKTIFPFPFTLNGIWSWWQFSFQFWTKWNSVWFRKSKGKLSPWSCPIQCERKWKYSFVSVLCHYRSASTCRLICQHLPRCSESASDVCTSTCWYSMWLFLCIEMCMLWMFLLLTELNCQISYHKDALLKGVPNICWTPGLNHTSWKRSRAELSTLSIRLSDGYIDFY